MPSLQIETVLQLSIDHLKVPTSAHPQRKSRKGRANRQKNNIQIRSVSHVQCTQVCTYARTHSSDSNEARKFVVTAPQKSRCLNHGCGRQIILNLSPWFASSGLRFVRCTPGAESRSDFLKPTDGYLGSRLHHYQCRMRIPPERYHKLSTSSRVASRCSS